MFHWLEQALSALLVLVVLLDIFLTVLHARIGTGLGSEKLARLTWRLFCGLGKLLGPRRGKILSFCGLLIVVLLVLAWASALTLGAALVMCPMLGTSIRASSGDTPTDFTAALYAGSSMAIEGASDFTPHTSVARLLFLFNSLVGASILSLTLSYLVQVYSALQRRNALGLKVGLLTAGTGDAAELVAGLEPRGIQRRVLEPGGARSRRDGREGSTPLLPRTFYFRFPEVRYSVSRISLVALDAVTLIRTVLDDERYGCLKETASVTQLWHASMMLLTTLEGAFLPGGLPDATEPPDEQTVERWRERYAAAAARPRQANIQTASDKRTGEDLRLAAWLVGALRRGAHAGYGLQHGRDRPCRSPARALRSETTAGKPWISALQQAAATRRGRLVKRTIMRGDKPWRDPVFPSSSKWAILHPAPTLSWRCTARRTGCSTTSCAGAVPSAVRIAPR